jgi:hypothetical protein
VKLSEAEIGLLTCRTQIAKKRRSPKRARLGSGRGDLLQKKRHFNTS